MYFKNQLRFFGKIFLMKKFSGIVEKGKNRGKKMGFPTANISLDQRVDEGIYVSLASVNNLKLPSLTFIGAAVTFGEEKALVETYILDFSEDLYGQEIEIELLEKIRDNKKFDSIDELIKQMEEDKKNAIDYFKKNV